DQRPRRQARNVEVLAVVEVRLADLPLDALADDEQLALECRLVRRARAAADEDLPDLGQVAARQAAAAALVDRHGAPAEQLLPLLAHDLRERLLAEVPFLHVARQ